MELLQDKYGRFIQDLRISITDRCNFRCSYCLPVDEFVHQPRASLLDYDEVERLAKIFVRLGVRKIRVTGGEPLLRKDVETLIAKMSKIEGLADLAMTTNAYLLADHIEGLKAAGLKRLNISLDSLHPEKFAQMTKRDGYQEVMRSIEAATRAGFHPLKINAVLMRGQNDDEIADFAEFAHETGHTIRFIEFMPLDSGHTWKREMVVPGKEVFETINRHRKLVPLPPRHAAETAKRYTFEDGRGEIGIIASVTQPFCGHCNRMRMTADGHLRTCLFSLSEYDVKGVIRSGASDDEIAQFLHEVVSHKEDRHHINDPDFHQPLRTMSCIGG